MNRRSLFGALAAVLAAPFLPAPVKTIGYRTMPLPEISAAELRAGVCSVERYVVGQGAWVWSSAPADIQAHQQQITRRVFGR